VRVVNGAGGSAIVGSDWPRPLPVTTYSEPTRRPTGLDWAKHTAPDPEPVDAAPEPVSEMPATRAQAYADNTAAHEEARQRVETIEARPADIPTNDIPADVTHPVVRLLEATADATDPATRSARELVVAALQHLRTVATSRPQPTPPTRPREPKTKPAKPRTPAKSKGRPRADTNMIVQAYESGRTIAQTAADLGYTKATVRTHLLDAGVQLRDDRKTNSGGNNRRDYTPTEIEDVRRLYVDEHLSQTRVAQRLGIGVKVVQCIMARHGIEAREGQSGGGDTLGEIRTRLAALGVKSTVVRAWALEQGLKVSPRGVIPLQVLDQYEQQHG